MTTPDQFVQWGLEGSAEANRKQIQSFEKVTLTVKMCCCFREQEQSSCTAFPVSLPPRVPSISAGPDDGAQTHLNRANDAGGL